MSADTYARNGFEDVLRGLYAVAPGGRNQALFPAACAALELSNTARQEVSRDEVLRRLLEVASAIGLPKREALTIIRSAERRVGEKRRNPRSARHGTSLDSGTSIRTTPIYSPPAPVYKRAPAEELASVWDLAEDVPNEVLANLSGKARPGIVGDRVYEEDLARFLPVGAELPGWGSWWARCGYRVVMRTFDAEGRAASLRARSVGMPTDGRPKEYSLRGYSAGGTVFACPLARRLFAGDHDAAELVRSVGLIATEGAPSFLAWASRYSDADESAPATIGYFAGGWTREHADRIPDGARVIVDPDDGETGEQMMAAIVQSLGRRVELVRSKGARHG